MKWKLPVCLRAIKPTFMFSLGSSKCSSQFSWSRNCKSTKVALCQKLPQTASQHLCLRRILMHFCFDFQCSFYYRSCVGKVFGSSKLNCHKVSTSHVLALNNVGTVTILVKQHLMGSLVSTWTTPLQVAPCLRLWNPRKVNWVTKCHLEPLLTSCWVVNG